VLLEWWKAADPDNALVAQVRREAGAT
jgi:hypothetical protein